MKRSTIAIIIFAFVMCLCVLATISNIHFLFLASMRTVAVSDGFDADYTTAVVALEKFAKFGDYQNWLVSSGSTFTGKVVRVVVMLAEIALFKKSFLALANNIEFIKKLSCKKKRNTY